MFQRSSLGTPARRSHHRLLGAVFAATGLAATLNPSTASACGGLFCSAAAPVDQTAERIVFAQNDDETITAIIEIQYQGPSERFGWLLPMPGTPKVSVSTKEVLDAIDRATMPTYQLNTTTEGTCKAEPRVFNVPGAPALAGPGISVEDNAGVVVVDQGNAGPYDYVTIDPDDELENPGKEAIEWLEENGYDVGAAPAVLDPYLAQGLNLVAFRLTKGQDAGAIRPVQLTYEGTTPSVPIIPTSVAAADDMGIRVFLLGEQRAASDNYATLKLNEARINWFNWQDGYDKVVSEAADEAGAFGFVTEFAGEASGLANTIWTDYQASGWSQLQAYEGTAGETMMAATGWFRGYEGFRRAVEASVDLPEGVDIQEFASSPTYYEAMYGNSIADKELFLKALEAEVIVPLQQAQKLVDGFPYLSRLYTTMSPEEMVEDPSFVYRKDIPAVSNVHEADLTILCSPDLSSWEAPWKLTLADGSQIYGDSSLGTSVPDVALPATATIETSGGEVILDNTKAIRKSLAAAAPNPPPVARHAAVARNDDSCSVASVGRANGDSPSTGYGLGVVGLGALLTRLRRRPSR